MTSGVSTEDNTKETEDIAPVEDVRLMLVPSLQTTRLPGLVSENQDLDSDASGNRVRLKG